MRMKPLAAFSLVELLTVIAILSLLAALLVPMFVHGLDAARRAACLSNLRQIYAGFALYAGDHKGLVPPKFEVKKMRLTGSDTTEGRVLNTHAYGIQTVLAPYLETEAVFHCPADCGDARNSEPLWKQCGCSYEVKGILKKDLGTGKEYFYARGNDTIVGDPFKPWEASDPLNVNEKIGKGEHGPKDWHAGWCNLMLPNGRAISVQTKEQEKAEQNKE
jgi:type II secretory pathway pseudopilin PulG